MLHPHGWPERKFKLLATCDEVLPHMQQRGTAIIFGGSEVWHLYELI